MKPLARFAFVAIALLVIWLAIDFLFFKTGQSYSSAAYYDYVFFPLAYLGFLWASWPLYTSRSSIPRNIYRALTAIAAFAIWFLPALVIAVQFHKAIGAPA